MLIKRYPRIVRCFKKPYKDNEIQFLTNNRPSFVHPFWNALLKSSFRGEMPPEDPLDAVKDDLILEGLKQGQEIINKNRSK